MKLNTDGKLTHRVIKVDGVSVDHYKFKQVIKLLGTRKGVKNAKRQVLRNV